MRAGGARHLPEEVAARPKQLGLRANANRWLRRHARPGFLEDGRLRDVLGVAAEPWRTMVRGLSSAPELGARTGEIWCRLVLEGSPARTVEDELWR